jgi:hypothetical protein
MQGDVRSAVIGRAQKRGRVAATTNRATRRQAPLFDRPLMDVAGPRSASWEQKETSKQKEASTQKEASKQKETSKKKEASKQKEAWEQKEPRTVAKMSLPSLASCQMIPPGKWEMPGGVCHACSRVGRSVGQLVWNSIGS